MRNRIQHPKYENLITKLLNGERLPQETGVLELLYVSMSLPRVGFASAYTP